MCELWSFLNITIVTIKYFGKSGKQIHKTQHRKKECSLTNSKIGEATA